MPVANSKILDHFRLCKGPLRIYDCYGTLNIAYELVKGLVVASLCLQRNAYGT